MHRRRRADIQWDPNLERSSIGPDGAALTRALLAARASLVDPALAATAPWLEGGRVHLPEGLAVGDRYLVVSGADVVAVAELTARGPSVVRALGA